jgi:hypothetical protein
MTAECARCGRPYVKRRSDHRFCKPECRKLGELHPRDRPDDLEAIDRLFDPRRDSADLAREDDWFPPSFGAEERELYQYDTVETRRRWYENLHERRARSI